MDDRATRLRFGSISLKSRNLLGEQDDFRKSIENWKPQFIAKTLGGSQQGISLIFASVARGFIKCYDSFAIVEYSFRDQKAGASHARMAYING